MPRCATSTARQIPVDGRAQLRRGLARLEVVGGEAASSGAAEGVVFVIATPEKSDRKWWLWCLHCLVGRQIWAS
jgi:hypothetical protein